MPFRHAFPLCLIALVWFAPDMVYGQNNRLIEPKDIAHLEYVTGAEMSPDGKHIAYLLAVPRRPLQDDDGSAWYELHVMDRQTGVTRPFITGEVSISSPQWSPDGKSIYYTSKRSDDKMKSLYRIPIDGGESVRVLGTPTSMGSFDISDDGNHVAFLAKEEQDDAIQDLEDEGFNQEIYEEDWLPTRVWVAALEGDSGRDAKQPKPRMLDLNGSALSVLWNPDGDELMVVLAPTPSVDDSYMQKRVFVVNAESGKVIRSLNNPGKLGQVSSLDSIRLGHCVVTLRASKPCSLSA